MFYLITTAASFIGTVTSVKAMLKRFDREGYEYKQEKKTKEEQRLDTLKVLSILLCPMVNLLFTGIMMFGYEKLYESFKESLINEKKLVKKEEKKPEEKIEVDMKTNELNRTRTYSELTPDEKLEFLHQERERLLFEKGIQQTGKKTASYNERGPYKK